MSVYESMRDADPGLNTLGFACLKGCYFEKVYKKIFVFGALYIVDVGNILYVV